MKKITPDSDGLTWVEKIVFTAFLLVVFAFFAAAFHEMETIYEQPVNIHQTK